MLWCIAFLTTLLVISSWRSASEEEQRNHEFVNKTLIAYQLSRNQTEQDIKKIKRYVKAYGQHIGACHYGKE